MFYSRQAKYNKISLMLILIGLILIFGLALWWIAYDVGILGQDVGVTDPRKLAVIQASKNLFEYTDRCDPIGCSDHFQVVGVEHLRRSVKLQNTGVAGIDEGFSKVKTETIRIRSIESSNRLIKKNQFVGQSVCRKGNYLVYMNRRNWLYLPIDFIRLCCHVIPAGF